MGATTAAFMSGKLGKHPGNAIPPPMGMGGPPGMRPPMGPPMGDQWACRLEVQWVCLQECDLPWECLLLEDLACLLGWEDPQEWEDHQGWVDLLGWVGLLGCRVGDLQAWECHRACDLPWALDPQCNPKRTDGLLIKCGELRPM